MLVAACFTIFSILVAPGRSSPRSRAPCEAVLSRLQVPSSASTSTGLRPGPIGHRLGQRWVHLIPCPSEVLGPVENRGRGLNLA